MCKTMSFASLVIKSQPCSPCGMSDASGLDMSFIAMIAAIGGYRFVFLECDLWGFLVPRLYCFCIVKEVFRSVLVMGILWEYVESHTSCFGHFWVHMSVVTVNYYRTQRRPYQTLTVEEHLLSYCSQFIFPIIKFSQCTAVPLSLPSYILTGLRHTVLV